MHLEGTLATWELIIQPPVLASPPRPTTVGMTLTEDEIRAINLIEVRGMRTVGWLSSWPVGVGSSMLDRCSEPQVLLEEAEARGQPVLQLPEAARSW